jgi:endonuclease-3
MATTINKQRVLTQIFTQLKKRYEAATSESLPVLEHFLYAVCREGTTREQADRAFRTLRERFFDWNEIRVSSTRELEEAMANLPEAEARALRLTSLLQEVFETTFSFDLETLHKKGFKQAAKHLARYQAANDYAVAYVVQQALGGHAIPLDAPSQRVLRRLGLLDTDSDDPETIRASLEHLVPKAKAQLFCELISALAENVCADDDPACLNCPLLADCPTGQELAGAAVVGARGGRPKPR